ncbi:MAG: hypothetical protein RLZZ190_421 [Actinomycetota bacterium]|jgi:heme/copper-type cytochrome/quinol oxidase subunit 2
MLRYLPLLIAVAVTLYALIDCARTEQEAIRGLPKWGWLLIIIFIGTFGAVAYLIWGRQRRQGPGRGGKGRVIGPDDDPDFLRNL